MKRSLGLACLALAFAAGPAAHAQNTDDGLQCEVDGNSVKLSWNIVFVRPIQAWLVSRDGQPITRLPPTATGYEDEDVTRGEHLYVLSAVNEDGSVGAIARCLVIVGEFGLKCEPRPPSHVFLSWERSLIAIDVVIDRFRIRRNGDVIADVPGDQFEYSDRQAGPGRHRYSVHGVVGDDEFLVGVCSVQLPEPPGLICRVDAPRVHLDWSQVILPRIAFRYFQIARDGEVVARVEPDQREYVDSPGEGDYHYVVSAVAGGRVAGEPAAPEYFVGECKVSVPGNEIPPVEELTCLDIDEDERLANDNNVLVGESDVLLVWQKPIDYDRFVITRNGVRIAGLPGEQFYYIDRNLPPGVYVYQVLGLVGGQVSPPATCRVVLPRDPLPPPTDLTCRYVGRDDAVGDVVDGQVVLEWRNGARYQLLVVVRNGNHFVRLEGTATRYVDRDPPPGINVYEVFGVAGFLRSEADVCRVDVPVGVVPPPEDLNCAILRGAEPIEDAEPSPVDGGPAGVAGDGDVLDDEASRFRIFLRWRNAAAYQRIVISRNGTQIAVLPGDQMSYRDSPPFLSGTVKYSVVGVILNSRSEAAECAVDLGPPFVPAPRDFQCDVDQVVLDDSINPNDPGGLPIPVVKISWVNPVRYAVLVLTIDDDQVIRLRGDAMGYRHINPGAGVHVYTLYGIGVDGGESRRVRCEVLVGDIVVPPVQNLTCVAFDANATGRSAGLRWENPIAYSSITIVRNNERIAELGGDAESYIDGPLEPGVYEYSVIAFVRELRSRPESCRVVVEGPQPEDVLYFSSGIFGLDADGEVVPDVDNRPGRITCMASNALAIQGWSFGVCHDPQSLQLADVSLTGTATQRLNDGRGPEFLILNRHENGVSMAAIIDQMDASNTLPSEPNHRLLNIVYEGGEDSKPGECYPVRYCNTLGDPAVAVLFVVRGRDVEPKTAPGRVCLPRPFPGPRYIRGDSDGSLKVDMTDSIVTLGWLFLGRREPPCQDAADANGSGEVNVADPVWALNWEFSGGPPPPAPFPDCGYVEPRLGCEEPSCPVPAI